MLVNFMIIGAQKCGTTSLSEILKKHPNIVGSSPKEPHFFSETKNWKDEVDKYHAHFQQEKNVLYFDASTSYTFYPYRNLHIWDNIFEYNPEMKFIYLVRSPYDRIVSSYMHAYERGHTDHSLQEALIKDRFHIEITRYYTQIAPYIRKFGRESIIIIDFDEFIYKQEIVLNQISEFLSIDVTQFLNLTDIHSNKSIGGKSKKHHRFESPPFYQKMVRRLFPQLWNKVMNSSDRTFDKKPKLNEEQKELISNFLQLEIIELQKLMNKDLDHWLDGFEPLSESLSLSKD